MKAQKKNNNNKRGYETSSAAEIMEQIYSEIRLGQIVIK